VSAYDEGERYRTQFPHRDLREGDALRLGAIRIEPLHTPGHTPEHLSYLVHDESRARDVPLALLSGDFLFVGSLGRPDLLGEGAAGELAQRMYRTCREKLAALPDGLRVHPAHGQGSMCGSGLGGLPSTTLGYERRANPYLDPALDEASFVARLLGNLPPFPDYYRRMKQLNSDGPPLLGELPRPPALDPDAFATRLAAGAIALDLRGAAAVAAGHLPRSLSLGAGSLLAQWAGWVVPPDRPLVLVASDERELELAARELATVGLDRLEGHLRGGVEAWRRDGRPLVATASIDPRELRRALAAHEPLTVLDVRGADEWQSGHIEGALHLPAAEIAARVDELPRRGTLAVICGSGYRSSLALSLLERAGRSDAIDVTGGMEAWRRGSAGEV
jgi:hydroxyacylglutathione hydrolase